MTNVDPFPIIRVNLEDADDVETLGTKPKFWWFNHQRTRLLFKAEDPNNRISKIGRQFTMDLLNENKKRILQMDIR